MSGTAGWLRMGLALMLWCLSLPATAACWRTTSLLTDVPIPGVELKVLPGAAVGTVIHTVAQQVSQPTSIRCGTGGGEIHSVFTQSEQMVSRPGDRIYPTRVAGIGVRVTLFPQGSWDIHYAAIQDLAANRDYGLGTGQFVVEFIKTADVIGVGPILQQGRFTSYRLQDQPGNPVLTSTVTGGGPVIVRPTCQVQASSQDIAIDLGPVGNTAFSGVGSRQGEQPFVITLQCEGATQPGNQSAIAIRLDGSHSTGMPGVLDVDAVPGAATGVGVELRHLAQGAPQPVSFGEPIPIGATSPGTRQLELPLRASYIQTQPGRVAPGPVRAMATFTIEYD